MSPNRDPHQRPWALVLLAAFVYDAWLIRRRRDSLSRHFASAAQRRPIVMSAGVAYLLAHLCGVLPRRGDAFQLVLAVRSDPENSPKIHAEKVWANASRI